MIDRETEITIQYLKNLIDHLLKEEGTVDSCIIEHTPSVITDFDFKVQKRITINLKEKYKKDRF